MCISLSLSLSVYIYIYMPPLPAPGSPPRFRGLSFWGVPVVYKSGGKRDLEISVSSADQHL